MDNRCAYPRCRGTEIAVVYYGRPICERCLEQRYARMELEEWKRKLGISEREERPERKGP